MILRRAACVAAVALMALTALPGQANAQQYVINGQVMPPAMAADLWARGIPPGAYMVDPYGNVVPMTFVPGRGWVPNQTVDTFSQGGRLWGGSGSTGPSGSTYYNPMLGNGGVGTFSDGGGCAFGHCW